MNAVLIMGHKNLNQIKMLIKRCLSEVTKIIVHLDKKMSVSKEEIKELNALGISLTDRRISGQLDDKSLVEITLEMIRKAKDIEVQESVHFKYYILLSGQDYLTKPITVINAKLNESYPQPFIDCTPYDKNNWVYHKFTNSNSVRIFNAWISSLKKNSLWRKGFRVVYLIYKRIINVLHKSDFYRLTNLGCKLYGGSAWWILPDRVINFIMDEYIHQPYYLSLLLNTYTPEETFFQIMTMRSDCKDLVEVNPKTMVAQNCKTWAYFFDEGKPFKGHPYIFTKQEYEKLINKDCWFARKFDITQSSEILDMLNDYLDNYRIV